jgi:hypothetical protein
MLAVLAVGALLSFPAPSQAQIVGGGLGGGVGGVGLQGLTGGGLGAPPAGVGLHQQYMQLYGLPVNFTQSQVNNGGQQGIFPGGFGGGLGGRFYGVNYQRQRLAAQYMQYAAMARYQQQMMAAYGQNLYPNQPTPATNVPTGSFGMSQGSMSQQPYFNSTPTAANNQFRGFGLASSFNSPLPTATSDEVKKDEKNDQKDETKDK